MLHADTILDSLERAYVRFHNNHNLPEMHAPHLDLAAHRRRGWKTWPGKPSSFAAIRPT